MLLKSRHGKQPHQQAALNEEGHRFEEVAHYAENGEILLRIHMGPKVSSSHIIGNAG